MPSKIDRRRTPQGRANRRKAVLARWNKPGARKSAAHKRARKRQTENAWRQRQRQAKEAAAERHKSHRTHRNLQDTIAENTAATADSVVTTATLKNPTFLVVTPDGRVRAERLTNQLPVHLL